MGHRYSLYSRVLAATCAAAAFVFAAGSAFAEPHHLPPWTPIYDVGTQATFEITRPLLLRAYTDAPVIFQGGHPIRPDEVDMSHTHCALIVDPVSFTREMKVGYPPLQLSDVDVQPEWFEAWKQSLYRTKIHFGADHIVRELKCYGVRPQGVTLEDLRATLGRFIAVHQGEPVPVP